MLDLLDLAQLDNNKFRLNKSYFNLEIAIDSAVSVVEHLALNKNVQFVKEF